MMGYLGGGIPAPTENDAQTDGGNLGIFSAQSKQGQGSQPKYGTRYGKVAQLETPRHCNDTSDRKTTGKSRRDGCFKGSAPSRNKSSNRRRADC